MKKKNHYFKLKNKKELEKVYRVVKKDFPLYADEICQNGIFLKGKTYSAMLELQENSPVQQKLFQLLRMREVKCRVINLSTGKGKKNTYLWISAEQDKDVFQKLVMTMIEEINTDIGICRQLDLNERVRLMHKIALLGNENQELNFTEYLNSAGEWKKDFNLSGLDFRDKGNQNETIIKGESKCLAIVCVQSYPDNLQQIKRINSKIIAHEDAVLSCRIIEPVKDYMVIRKIKSEYMGLESTLLKIKKEDATFYQLYTEENQDDTDRYSFGGILALFMDESEKKLQHKLGELEQYVRGQQGRLLIISAHKKAAYENLMLNRCDNGFTRIIYSKYLGAFGDLYENEELFKTEHAHTISQYINY